METTHNNSNSNSDDKTVAILAYITMIGFIVAIILNSNNKTKLGTYHLRQALGLIVCSVGIWLMLMFLAFLPVLGFITILLSPIMWIGVLVLIVLGILNASSGQEKPLPLVGTYFEKWFANVFA